MTTYKDIMSILDRKTKNVSVYIDTALASYGINGMSELQARKSVFAERVANWKVINISSIDSFLDEDGVGIFIEITPPTSISGYFIEKLLSESEDFNDKWDAECYQSEKTIRTKKEEQRREDMNKAIEKPDFEKAFEGNEEFHKAMDEIFKKYWAMLMKQRQREEDESK